MKHLVNIILGIVCSLAFLVLVGEPATGTHPSALIILLAKTASALVIYACILATKWSAPSLWDKSNE